ncbi:hypothetical protein [Streptomyces sp. NPDC088707]|uniref:hypothetical protein n=1 Tax=Streptomyces sp. NPDC088707 TaxID=3365871 RepID=UPI00381F05FE
MPEPFDGVLTIGLPGVGTVLLKALQALFFVADCAPVFRGLVHRHPLLSYHTSDPPPLAVLGEGDPSLAQGVWFIRPSARETLAYRSETYALHDLVQVRARRFTQHIEASRLIGKICVDKHRKALLAAL